MASVTLPAGIVCTLEEYTRSLSDPSIHCVDRGQSIGLVLAAESGLVSLLALLVVFRIIFRNLLRHIRHAPPGMRIDLDPMEMLMLSLFFADFVQALGAVLDIKWVNEGKVEIGSFCTAQGVIQQLGETGVAITTLVIAIYTFAGVWWRVDMKSFVAKIIIGLVWLFIILMVTIGNVTHRNKHELYESPTPYWCWIGQGYLGFRIWGEYVWLWITLVFSILAYVPLFLWSQGNITPDENSWWRFSVHRTNPSIEDADGRRRESLTMIAYPIVYSILVLPISVVRWIGFVQERGGRTSHVPSAATLAVVSIYGLSGAMNVVLLLLTRPESIIFGHRPEYVAETGRAPSPIPLTKRGANEEQSEHYNGPRLGRLPSLTDEGHD